MDTQSFLFKAVLYLVATVVSVPIAKRLGLGTVLGYLIAGALLGPFAFKLLGGDSEELRHVAEFGIIMMLFIIGLELQPSLLWRMRSSLLGLGGLQVVGTTAVITLAAMAVGCEWKIALTIGLILSLSSTAIILQTLQEKNLMTTPAGRHCFSVLLFQDIAVIPILALMPLLGTGHANGGGHGGHGSAASGPMGVLLVIGSVVGIILAGRFVIRPVFRMIAQSHVREIFTAAALLLVATITLLMLKVGLSPALGAFLAGVVLADSEYRHELEADIEPFKGLLLGLFFVSVGAGIDFAIVRNSPTLIVSMTLGLVGLKVASLFVLGKVFKMETSENLLFSLALAQGGEFCFVLIAFAVETGIFGQAVAGPVTASVALSMAITPLLFVLYEKVILPRFALCRQSQQRAEDEVESNEGSVLIAGFGRFGNIVGRFLKMNGVPTTVLDLDSEQVDLLRKIGMKLFYGDASRLALMEAAGAAKARAFVLAVDSPEKSLEIARTVMKHFPDLPIFARAHDRTHAYELMDIGVTHVFHETMGSSVMMGVNLLTHLGARSYQAERAAQKFLRYEWRSIRELASIHRDEDKHMERAQQLMADLEKLLRDSGAEEFDAGWDPPAAKSAAKEP